MSPSFSRCSVCGSILWTTAFCLILAVYACNLGKLSAASDCITLFPAILVEAVATGRI